MFWVRGWGVGMSGIKLMNVTEVIILSQAKKLNKRLKRVGLTVSLRGIKVPFIIIVVNITITDSIIIIGVIIIVVVNITIVDSITIITIINIKMIPKVVECDSGLPTMDYSIYRCFWIS